MNDDLIMFLCDTVDLKEAATKSYADGQAGLRVLKAGDTMTGKLLVDILVAGGSSPDNDAF